MNIFDGNLIRKKMHEILILLYMFRGMTNEQLRRYIHVDDTPNRSRLANLSRHVSTLKKLKLVKSISCHPYSKQELNFLTRKGIEYINEFCQIETEGYDDQVGFSSDGPFRYFEYDILTPPGRYIEHHLMLIDAIVKYKQFSFRHNLHCVKKYEFAEINGPYTYKRKAKLKPDAELLTQQGHLAAVEIDTGTERYEKLLNKFMNYKRYFDYCVENDIPIPWVAIVFYTKRGNEKLTIEEDQRWQTILKAAVEGLSYYCWRITIVAFNRPTFIKMLKEQPDQLIELGINPPTKINEVLKVKKEREEKDRQEEVRKQRELEEHRRKQQEKEEMLRRRRLEIEQARITMAKRLEEEDKKKKGILGWFK